MRCNFLVIALVTASLCFSGVAGAASGIAQVRFLPFISFLIISLVIGAFRRA